MSEGKQIDWSKAPAGATHWGPETSGFCECWYMFDGDKVLFAAEHNNWAWREKQDALMDSRKKQIVARPAPEQEAWTGTDLPPVGTVCEVDYEGWTTCEIIAHFQQRCGMVAAFTIDQVGNGAKTLDAFGAEHFRPIRTPEQIAAEEREKAIDEVCAVIVSHYEAPKMSEHYLGLAAALYDAGYRKAKGEQ